MTTLRQLGWPNFHKSATTQRQWDAADPAGRIKIELSAGFNEELGGKMVFTKLSTIVTFAFFPAPIGKPPFHASSFVQLPAASACRLA